MRRITLWLLATITAVVLLFSYKTSTGGVAGGGVVAVGNPAQPAGSGSGSDSGSAASGSGSGTTGSSGSTSGSGSSGSTSGSKTYQGATAQTRWGPVQVAITVAAGKITDVSVPVYPDGNRRDQEINAYALPILRQETLSAQSAAIDAVSGATVTTDGYIESLQSALDAAHLP